MACLPVSRFPKLQVVPKAHISRVLSKRQGFRRVLAPALQRPGLFLLVCQSRSSVELFFCSTKSWSWSSPTKRKGVPSAWNFPLEPLKELLDLVPNGTSQFKYFRTGLPPHGQAPLCRVPDRNTGACRFVPVPARIFSVPAKLDRGARLTAKQRVVGRAALQASYRRPCLCRCGPLQRGWTSMAFQWRGAASGRQLKWPSCWRPAALSTPQAQPLSLEGELNRCSGQRSGRNEAVLTFRILDTT